MGLISWIILGLLAAWIAGMVTGRTNEGCLTKIAVGIIGAFIGGALANAAGEDADISELSLRSVLLAALGATVLQFVLGAIERRPSR